MMTPNQIRMTRTFMGMTQVELAINLGVRPNDVSKWELGDDFPLPQHDKKLSEWFAMFQSTFDWDGVNYLPPDYIANFRTTRRRFRVSHTDIERHTGIPAVVIREIEAGRFPVMARVKRIMDALLSAWRFDAILASEDYPRQMTFADIDEDWGKRYGR